MKINSHSIKRKRYVNLLWLVIARQHILRVLESFFTCSKLFIYEIRMTANLLKGSNIRQGCE